MIPDRIIPKLIVVFQRNVVCTILNPHQGQFPTMSAFLNKHIRRLLGLIEGDAKPDMAT